MRINAITLFFLLGVTLTTAVLMSSTMGYISIPFADVVKVMTPVFFSGDAGNLPIPDSFSVIITDVRLPRILSAAMVGGGLAIAGGVFQAILLNPLADPYTLGISSGAAFGAATAFILPILGITAPFAVSVPLFAFLGAIATLFAVFYLSSRDSSLSSNTLILSGVIVAAILSAGIGFIKYLADEEVNTIIFWLMGSFIGKSWSDVFLLVIVLFPCLFYMCFYSRDLNIMSLGREMSDTLGVDSGKTRRSLLICASLATAVCVSTAGVIGFIGLIVPHIIRILSGPDNRVLLPASFMAGAILLLSADTITRSVLPHEIPIGILTALIGGPFFCYIFRKKQVGGIHAD